MAQIDVSELMVDPDFIDKITLIHQSSSVNSHGENVIGETSVYTVGSVQPANEKAIKRLPDALQVSDMSSFWVKGVIIATEPGKYTDVLVFRGKRYQIVSIQNWSNFGAGFSEGICVEEQPSGSSV